MRTSDKTNTIVMTAMMMCLVLVTTYTFKIPTPFQGYVHLGDAMIFLSVLIVGKKYGAVAAAFGSALADLIGGYPIYIIPTLIIKFFMAFSAAYIVKCFSKMNLTFIGKLLGGIVAEVVMVLGYYIFDALIYSGFIGAFATVPGNLFQGGIGIVFAIIISELLRTSKMDKKLF